MEDRSFYYIKTNGISYMNVFIETLIAKNLLPTKIMATNVKCFHFPKIFTTIKVIDNRTHCFFYRCQLFQSTIVYKSYKA